MVTGIKREMEDTFVTESTLLKDIFKRLRGKTRAASTVVLDKKSKRRTQRVFSKRFSEIALESKCESLNDRLSSIKCAISQSRNMTAGTQDTSGGAYDTTPVSLVSPYHMHFRGVSYAEEEELDRPFTAYGMRTQVRGESSGRGTQQTTMERPLIRPKSCLLGHNKECFV